MALLAHQAGAKIAFCALPANLRDSVPTTGASLPWDQPDFFSAWTAWEEEDAARAVRLFAARVASVPGDPHAHYWLARALDMVGRTREAARSYSRAADLDRPGERTSPARAGIVRRVARESDAILVDLAAAFSARSPLGTTDGTLMRDACHWRHAYDPWVADLSGSGGI
ncbi:MAG TPA: hypothetical protein DCZ01_12555 [Elusimicrobia bacterium]|nr:MAG: hypothetical protein A2X37_04800 [Elusimicrobia bacterium GWA2_66_18]OGR71931.1 MAG: hypothetical protein A2X40_01625 [Elusimicrobia bacterium GWC2_65_9]HAZ09318.1 hypothetical protein [Elusimicrobiota bacterium]